MIHRRRWLLLGVLNNLEEIRRMSSLHRKTFRRCSLLFDVQILLRLSLDWSLRFSSLLTLILQLRLALTRWCCVYVGYGWLFVLLLLLVCVWISVRVLRRILLSHWIIISILILITFRNVVFNLRWDLVTVQILAGLLQLYFLCSILSCSTQIIVLNKGTYFFFSFNFFLVTL